MARKRRSHGPGGAHPAMPAPSNPNWKWRTTPVAIALTGGFVAGWQVALIGAGKDPGMIAWIIFYVFMFGFALSLSRITRWLTERWILRRRRRELAAAAAGTTPRTKKRVQDVTVAGAPTDSPAAARRTRG